MGGAKRGNSKPKRFAGGRASLLSRPDNPVATTPRLQGGHTRVPSKPANRAPKSSRQVEARSSESKALPHWFRERTKGFISYDSTDVNPGGQTRIMFKPIPEET